MTNEDKELLLKDLCARLQYGVKINCFDIPRKLLGISVDEDDFVTLEVGGGHFYYPCSNALHDECLPYLRPMSSMTEEEGKEYIKLLANTQESTHYIPDEKPMVEFVDWLNKHHIDYHNLIEKGLAMEAPEGMYKI